MGFKEVNELRKEGHLQQAYEIALQDFNRMPDDTWAARALFWTLHDMAHEKLRQGMREEAEKMASQMKDLMPRLDNEPDVQGQEGLPLPERALARLERHIQPFYADVKAAYLEAKKGDTIAPYDFIAQLIVDNQLASPLHERAGWIIWHHLWKQHTVMPSAEARQALAHYMNLTGVERPSVLHSHILMAAIKVSKRFSNEFDFAKFMELWRVDNFMSEDWERHPHKNNPKLVFPSLVEQTVVQYVSYKKKSHDLDYDDFMMTLLEAVVKHFPDKDDYQRYLSLALLQRGEKERALQLHRKLAMTMGKYYVWHELAGMCTHDLELKTSALCKALSMGAPDNFTSEIHRQLGWELAREGDMSAALLELEIYSSIRKKYGWPTSWRYEQLRKRIPVETQPAMSNLQLYQERAKVITDWVYADVPTVEAIVVGRFRDRQGHDFAKLVMPGGKSMLIKPSKLPRDERYLRVRVSEGDNEKMHLLTAEPADRNAVVPAFGESVTGDVKIIQGQAGKQYGFVEGCFVPGQLLEGVTNGETITILTEMQADGRRRATAII